MSSRVSLSPITFMHEHQRGFVLFIWARCYVLLKIKVRNAFGASRGLRSKVFLRQPHLAVVKARQQKTWTIICRQMRGWIVEGNVIRAHADVVCYCCSVVVVLSKLNSMSLVLSSCFNSQCKQKSNLKCFGIIFRWTYFELTSTKIFLNKWTVTGFY